MVRAFALASLALGCAPPSDLQGNKPPPSIIFDVPAEVTVGENLSLTVTGSLLDGERIYIARGTDLGAGPCLAVAGGLCVDIEDPALLGTATATGGSATLDLTIPPNAPLGDVALQALVVRGIGGQQSELTNAELLSLVAIGTGCTDPTSANYDPTAGIDDGSCLPASCTADRCTDVWIQGNGPGPMDVLLVIDTSSSMSAISDDLANSTASLVNRLHEASPDWQVAVITADMDDPTQAGRIQGRVDAGSPTPVADLRAILDQGANGSNDERVFDAVLAALDAPLSSTTNAGFPRPNARLQIGVFSDDDDESVVSVEEFVTDVQALAPRDVVYSLYTPGQTLVDLLVCGLFGGAVQPAPRHHEARWDLFGTWTDVCFAVGATTFFDELTPEYDSDRSRNFGLTCEPDGLNFDLFVDGTPVPRSNQNGWSYNQFQGVLTFHGRATPNPGQRVELSYDIDGSCAPPGIFSLP